MKIKQCGLIGRIRGFSLLAWLLTIPLFIIALLVFSFGFYEVRKLYWDSKVKELCEKEGGITVFENITITETEYQQLGGEHGSVPLPDHRARKPDSPYFRETYETKIREWDPEVIRGETLIKRRSDGKVLARSVQYWRRGGDLPTGLFHDSSFMCPKEINLSKQIFKVEAQK